MRHSVEAGSGLIDEAFRAQEQVRDDVGVERRPSRPPDAHPGVDFGRRRSTCLFVPPGLDPVEDGAAFNDIPFNQISDVLLHGPVVPAGESLERRTTLAGTFRTVIVGLVHSFASIMPARRRLRFGFERASARGLVSQWEGMPDDAFMVLVLDLRAMLGAVGVARYRDEFNEVA